MTPIILAAVLAGGLFAMAFLGPWLFRRAAPALVRVPRLAIAVLCGGIVTWLGTLLALGPLLAWTLTGPNVLPEHVAATCQRCLNAANPFSAETIETAVPVILLLVVPVLAAIAVAVTFAHELVRWSRASRRGAEAMTDTATRRRLLGHDVYVVADHRPFAMTFPARYGGVVISTGALAILDRDELSAVLEHENAHLRGRHHILTAVVGGLAARLRWVPLIVAVEDMLPHYLEIAADNRARHHAGTPALVGALVKLGERAVHGGHPSTVLHVAGPERIRQLVHPCTGGAGTLAAAVVTFHLGALAVVASAVHIPYAAAAVTGCL
ncbi:MAG TPA: M56 family metallopeptidase [Candidatus Stackebrandtia excrementipullorum]|nr:M56 family metallopeptidase [Candidatus Stackebrandtia excrementipullorum]